jgi:hypothetical protein
MCKGHTHTMASVHQNAAPSMCMQSVGERPAISEREADSSSGKAARHAHTDTVHDRRNPRHESHRGPAMQREREACVRARSHSVVDHCETLLRTAHSPWPELTNDVRVVR